MDRRIMGLESEIGIAGINEGQGRFVNYLLEHLTDTDTKAFLMRSAADIDPIFNAWLVNGARFYNEAAGNHPEYATPECVNVKDLVACDKASEIILKRVFNALPLDISIEWPFGGPIVFSKNQILLVKNNVAKKVPQDLSPYCEASWGAHENYMVPGQIIEDVITTKLIPHLVARTIFTGAGHIWHYAGQSRFVVSSRAMFIDQRLGSASHVHRPFLFFRREPHTVDAWQRIQIASGESNMLELPTFLKFMTTHLCLRLIEEGWSLPKGFEMLDPVLQIKEVSYDLLCRIGLQLKYGKCLRAIEIEKIYLDAAKELKPLSAEEQLGLELWQWVLGLLSKDLRNKNNLKALFGVSDWATKWYIVRNRIKNEGLVLNHPKILSLNPSYHCLIDNPARSLWRCLELKDKEKPFMHHVVSQSDVESAVHFPPLTRAKIRSDLINFCLNNSRAIRIGQLSWSEATCYLKNSYGAIAAHNIILGHVDPFAVQSQSFEDFKKLVESTPT